jgi:DNA-binding response OmpR family regulator
MTERNLVVDDEEFNRDYLEAILTQDGFEVELAVDGVAALAQATAAPPDLILLDLLLPKMTGLEACQRLKQAPATGDVPIIVVTAVGQVATKEAALTSGADDFMTKPVRPEDLRMRVGAMLKVRRIRQDLDRTLAYLHELEAARQAQRHAALAQIVAEPGAGSPQSPTPMPILLVDDDALTRQFYGDLLVEHGFRVFAVSSGAEGLELSRQHSIDVVILDIMMPGMSGLEVLERLHAEDPDLPVIMLTGHSTSQNAIAALKLGAYDFIVKGLDHSLVALAVHRALRHRRETLKTKEELAQLRAHILELERFDSRHTLPNA